MSFERASRSAAKVGAEKCFLSLEGGTVQSTFTICCCQEREGVGKRGACGGRTSPLNRLLLRVVCLSQQRLSSPSRHHPVALIL